jgi:hypothetical protein
MALALLAQRAPPLQLDFTAYPVQLLLAVMWPEVLVEASKHLPQVTLLIAPFPVHIPNQPLMGASKKLATALDAGEPDQRETSIAISSADMFEAEKLESFRPPVDACASLGGESAKEQQPSFLLGQFQLNLASRARSCL